MLLRSIVGGFLAALIAAVAAQAQAPVSTLQGRITTDKIAPQIVAVLENPRARSAEVARAEVDADGNYRIEGLRGAAYRLTVTIDGKRQDRRDIEIVCRPGALVSMDFHFGKHEPTLVLHFPAEDPDFVDVAELASDYPREVVRDYERARQDHFNGNLVRAVQRLEAVVARAPRFYGAHARLGLLFQQSGCFGDAEEEYRRASEISPRSVQPLLNLASVQIRAAEGAEREAMTLRAIGTVRRALEINPASALAHCLAGAAHVKVSAHREAEVSFKKALEIDGELGAARLMLANLYLKQEKWEEASANLEAYLEDFPFSENRPFVRSMLAEAQRKRVR